MLEFGAKNCQGCREEITEDYAHLSASVVAVNTQAISLANTIKSGDPAAVIIFFASLYVYIFDVYDSELPAHWAWIMIWVGTVIPLLAIPVWFIKFRRFGKIADEEFMQKKREMLASLKLWLALFVVQAIAFATL